MNRNLHSFIVIFVFMTKEMLIVNKCHECFVGPFRFQTFHLDRSSTLDMTWQDHGILRIATMIQNLVHVRVTESLVMLLWDHL